MVPTNDTAVFLRKNDKELHFMITKIAMTYNYQGSLEDLIQDFYLKLLTSDIIESYKEDFHGPDSHTKISTYIYPIIKNFIIGKFKTVEYRLSNHCSYNNQDDMSDETFFDTLKVSPDYSLEIIQHNKITEENDQAQEDIQIIKDKFQRSGLNKKYPLRKRKNKNFQALEECNLLAIFGYLYEGYTNREIARIYGVSFMYITYLKQQLAANLIKNDLKPKLTPVRRKKVVDTTPVPSNSPFGCNITRELQQGVDYTIFDNSNLLYCKIKGLKATAYFNENGLVVMKGSEAVLNERNCVKKYDWPLNRRQKLKNEGILVSNGDRLVFTRDYTFNTPSTAASVIYGGHANGPKAWRNRDGKYLKDIQQPDISVVQYDIVKMPEVPVLN